MGALFIFLDIVKYILCDDTKLLFKVLDLPDPEVTISGPTTAIAGEQLVLTCTVRVVQHLHLIHLYSQ